MIPYHREKLIAPSDWKLWSEAAKAKGLSIVTLNGSFDLLHAGHLYIIQEAAKQADLLLVALNSDASIRSYKSADRPIISLNHRLTLMAALECVDFVTWFEETDPCCLILEVAPHVHVNGAEYGTDCVEKSVIDQVGARLHLVDRIPSLATSEVISKIRNLQPERV